MLSIIIPAYNEERTIAETIQVLSSFFKKKAADFELIVISDGSRDKTYDVAKSLAEDRVRVFSYPENRGKGHTLRYGFGKSRGDPVIFFDAGLNFPPAQIEDFVEQLGRGGVGLVVGSKRHPHSKVDYPWHRRLVSFGAQTLVRFLFGLGVTDTQVGLKAFRRNVLERIIPLCLVKRYAFDIELLALAHHGGFKIEEAPVDLNLKFSTAASLDSIWKCLTDTLAVFYRLKVLKFYDRPEAERKRLLAEYPVNRFDHLVSFVFGDILNRSG